MQIAKPFVAAAPIMLALAGQPAMAQSVAAPVPDPWNVAADPQRSLVRISKAALTGSAQFVGGCSKAIGMGFIGTFSRYGGTGLQTVDGESERVLFEVSGEDWKEAFAVQLRYAAAGGSWEIVNPLAPVFLASFSRGQQLTVVNSQRQRVFSFDLTGSTAAVRAMRTTCGIP